MFFQILFYYRLLQDIEYSSLCYIVGPCCLSTLQIVVCICYPNYIQIYIYPNIISNSQFTLPLFRPLCVCACVHACVCACSVVSDSATPWTVTHQAPFVHRFFSGKNTGVGFHFSSCRGSSQPRDQTQVSCISCLGRQFLYQYSDLGSHLSPLVTINLFSLSVQALPFSRLAQLSFPVSPTSYDTAL